MKNSIKRLGTHNPGSRRLLLCVIALIMFIGSPLTVFAQTGKADAFFRIFESGTYHMKAKIISSGMETDMESYSKGGMIATAMPAMGQRMIFKDNKMYMIMDAAKMVMVMPVDDTSQAGGVETDNMKPVGSGTASFGGKSLPYEEYRDSEGSRVQYFLDGAKLAGIRTICSEGNTDIIISVLDQNVPNNVFDIPNGYQVQDMPSFR